MHQLRKLLLPLSWLYAIILRIRHFLYDSGILNSYTPHQKIIVVGNLSLGGTGKTPMANFLIGLHKKGSVAVLSRGYGRTTKGTLEVDSNMSTEECGDEPLLIKKKNPQVLVLVDENRANGLEYLKSNYPEIKTVILDDAMQHRKVKPELSLLLTTFEKPFPSDSILPAGNLRDIKSRAYASDAIVVTKTPINASEKEKREIKSKLLKYAKPIFFSIIKYGDICSLKGDLLGKDQKRKVVGITGIAKPSYFIDEVATRFEITRHFDYPDHHEFTLTDIKALSNFIDTFDAEKPIVLTTEKDAQRLAKFQTYFLEKGIDVYYWKIETDFGEDADKFNKLINPI